MPTSDLVSQAKAGSLVAFDELVSAHQEHVFALAYRILGNADDAADVQQETFVRAWRSLGRFREQSGFATWLHRIAVNACLSMKRRRRYEASLDDEAMARPLFGAQTACAESLDTGVAVREALAEMHPQHRVLIVLREMEGRSYEEIAAVLGCSPVSARVRVSRARAILREKMQPYLAEVMR